jgi:hypothetical protein
VRAVTPLLPGSAVFAGQHLFLSLEESHALCTAWLFFYFRTGKLIGLGGFINKNIAIILHF